MQLKFQTENVLEILLKPNLEFNTRKKQKQKQKLKNILQIFAHN